MLLGKIRTMVIATGIILMIISAKMGLISSLGKVGFALFGIGLVAIPLMMRDLQDHAPGE
jgi:hypothetical protein